MEHVNAFKKLAKKSLAYDQLKLKKIRALYGLRATYGRRNSWVQKKEREEQM